MYYPQDPTKWTEGLAKVYDRQAKQLEEHHANLRARDKAELDVLAKDNFVTNLAKVAEFSSTAQQLMSQYKQKKEDKDTETTRQLNNYLQNNPAGTKWFREQSEKYGLDRGSFFKEYDKNKGGISQLKQDAIAAGQEDFVVGLRKVDSKDSVILREAIATNTAQSLKGRWDDHFASFDTKQLKNWNSLDVNGQLQFQNNWKIKQIDKLGVSDGFAAALIAGELKHQSTTAKNLKRASTLTAHQTNQTRFFKALIGTSATAFNPKSFGENFVIAVDSRVENFTDIVEADGTVITARHQAAEAVFNDLQELNVAGFIPDISKLADYKFAHPAGKNGEASIFDAFFDKDGDYYNRLVEGNKIGQTKLLSAATQIDLHTLGQLQQAAIQGKDVSQELQLLKNNGLLSEEQIKSVSDIGIYDNTQESYDEVKESYNKRNILNGGNLVAHEEDIKQEKNIKFKNEQLTRIKHHKERRKQLGYPEDDIAFVRSRITKAFDLTLGEDEKLPGKLHDLQIHLVQKLRKTFQDNIETPDHQPIIDPNGWILTNNSFEDYVIKNGIDVTSNAPIGKTKAKPKEGEGIFSADSNGNLRLWKTFDKQRIDAIKELNQPFNKTTVDRYTTNVETEFMKARRNFDITTGVTSLDRVLNKPESLLTKEDILGFFSQGKVSPEIQLKSQLLGMPPRTLIRRQFAALVDSGDYDDYLKLHDLNSIEIPVDANETLDAILKTNNNRDLRFNFNRGYTSPKINARLLNQFQQGWEQLGLPNSGIAPITADEKADFKVEERAKELRKDEDLQNMFKASTQYPNE